MIKKSLGGCGQKWVWPVWSWDSKIDCTARRNGWNELIFCMLVQIQESLKLFNSFFEWVLSKMGVATYLVCETLKSQE